MEEDLIECVTSMLFEQEDFTELIINLCKICTSDDQKTLEARMAEAANVNIKPFNLEVSPYFTLDESSKIFDFYRKQVTQKNTEELELRKTELKAAIRELRPQDYDSEDDDKMADVGGSGGMLQKSPESQGEA
jgi:hypothetical protein